MKILLIDNACSGHHLYYINGIIEMLKSNNIDYGIGTEGENFTQFSASKMYELPPVDGFFLYSKWIRTIAKILKEESFDIVHIITGDNYLRMFGWGISSLNRMAQVIVTFHHYNSSFLRNASYRRIADSASAVVVHTASIKEALDSQGIKNVRQIEYPQCNILERTSKQEACERLGLGNSDATILLALGGTRIDKGLDILLDALSSVKENFYLIIAGKEEDFTKDYIEAHIESYRDKVKLLLQFLPDDLYQTVLNAADIVVLPYRQIFDGASGPLCNGVWLDKEIIGPSHGSLGQIIEKNDLGSTFETENAASLSEVISKSLNTKWKPDTKYQNYKKSISLEQFQNDYKELYEGLIQKRQ